MYINRILFADALTALNQITHQYRLTALASDNRVRSVDQFRTTCETYLKTKIHLKVQKEYLAAPIVKGMYIARPDGEVDVVLAKGLNHCWSRFIVAKEICHLVMDKEELRSTAIVDTVPEIVFAIPDETGADARVSSVTQAEFVAEMLAMEFLFPYSDRVAELKANLLSPLEMAEKYKAPQRLVEKVTSKPIMDVLSTFHSQS